MSSDSLFENCRYRVHLLLIRCKCDLIRLSQGRGFLFSSRWTAFEKHTNINCVIAPESHVYGGR